MTAHETNKEVGSDICSNLVSWRRGAHNNIYTRLVRRFYCAPSPGASLKPPAAVALLLYIPRSQKPLDTITGSQLSSDACGFPYQSINTSRKASAFNESTASGTLTSLRLMGYAIIKFNKQKSASLCSFADIGDRSCHNSLIWNRCGRADRAFSIS